MSAGDSKEYNEQYLDRGPIGLKFFGPVRVDAVPPTKLRPSAKAGKERGRDEAQAQAIGGRGERRNTGMRQGRMKRHGRDGGFCEF